MIHFHFHNRKKHENMVMQRLVLLSQSENVLGLIPASWPVCACSPMRASVLPPTIQTHAYHVNWQVKLATGVTVSVSLCWPRHSLAT